MVCLQLQNSGADAELRMQGDTAQKGTLKKTDLKDSGGGGGRESNSLGMLPITTELVMSSKQEF